MPRTTLSAYPHKTARTLHPPVQVHHLRGNEKHTQQQEGQGDDVWNDNVRIYHDPFGGEDEPTWNRNEGREASVDYVEPHLLGSRPVDEGSPPTDK